MTKIWVILLLLSPPIFIAGCEDTSLDESGKKSRSNDGSEPPRDNGDKSGSGAKNNAGLTGEEQRRLAKEKHEAFVREKLAEKQKRDEEIKEAMPATKELEARIAPTIKKMKQDEKIAKIKAEAKEIFEKNKETRRVKYILAEIEDFEKFSKTFNSLLVKRILLKGSSDESLEKDIEWAEKKYQDSYDHIQSTYKEITNFKELEKRMQSESGHS